MVFQNIGFLINERWIGPGWLRNQLQDTNRHDGSDHNFHKLRDADLLEFIKAHPQEINLGKTDGVWLLDLILLRGAELS
jgi:hypothetical protein